MGQLRSFFFSAAVSASDAEIDRQRATVIPDGAADKRGARAFTRGSMSDLAAQLPSATVPREGDHSAVFEAQWTAIKV